MQLMETVKEIPEDFKKWVSEKAMSFSRYLIYSARSKNEALVHCTSLQWNHTDRQNENPTEK